MTIPCTPKLYKGLIFLESAPCTPKPYRGLIFPESAPCTLKPYRRLIFPKSAPCTGARKRSNYFLSWGVIQQGILPTWAGWPLENFHRLTTPSSGAA